MSQKFKMFAAAGVVALMLVIAPVVYGARVVSTGSTTMNTSSTLAQLIILDSLFSDQAGTGSILGVDSSELTKLIVLDSLFNGNNTTLIGGQSGSANTLSELLILDSLFDDNDDTTDGDDDLSQLGKLLIINGLFSPRVVTNTVTVPGSTGNTGTTTPTVDTNAPVISNITVSNVASTSAAISWTTNEAADTHVYISTNFPVEISNATRVSGATTRSTSHTVNLTNLQAHTVYFFIVESTDGSGNIMRTVAQNFITT